MAWKQPPGPTSNPFPSGPGGTFVSIGGTFVSIGGAFVSISVSVPGASIALPSLPTCPSMPTPPSVPAPSGVQEHPTRNDAVTASTKSRAVDLVTQILHGLCAAARPRGYAAQRSRPPLWDDRR